MSLRLRLFLLLGALVALLVVAQGWMARALTRDLSAEVGELALSVGSSMATVVGGGEVVFKENHVIEDEDGRHHVSVIRRVRTVDGAAGSETSNEMAWHSLPEEGGGATETERVEDGGIQQDVTVVLLREGNASTKPSLMVQGAAGLHAIPIPDRGLDARVDRFTRRLQFGSLGLLAIGLLLAAAVAHRVSAPLRDLSTAARRVGEGELGTQAPEPSDPEVALAVRSFNRMSHELARLDHDRKALHARRHLAELGEVARGLAHTLRNPLNALGLTVEELAARASEGGAQPGGESDATVASEDPSDENAALVASARQQIRRIDRSIRSFLLLAAEGASADGLAEPVDLERLAEDVVLEALQDCRRAVRITVDSREGEPSDGSKPPTVHGVAAELRAVLQALIVNAVEASPDGGWVRVRFPASPERAVVEVIDQGAGLAAELRAHLFEPHRTTKPEGSGMGLFLSHRIATDRYGGQLSIEDADPGAFPPGTRARLELGDRHAGDENRHGEVDAKAVVTDG